MSGEVPQSEDVVTIPNRNKLAKIDSSQNTIKERIVFSLSDHFGSGREKTQADDIQAPPVSPTKEDRTPFNHTRFGRIPRRARRGMREDDPKVFVRK